MRTFCVCLATLTLLATSAIADQPDDEPADGPVFSAPIRLKGGEQLIATESPGYACPCWYDFDGDGQKDLIVGQFAGGKINIFRNLGNGELAAGQWLMVGDTPAEVPGIW